MWGTAPVTEEPEVPFPWILVVFTVGWTLVFGERAVYWGVRWLSFDEAHVGVICTEGTSGCFSEGQIRVNFIFCACIWLYPFVGTGAALLASLWHDARQERRSRWRGP